MWAEKGARVGSSELLYEMCNFLVGLRAKRSFCGQPGTVAR